MEQIVRTVHQDQGNGGLLSLLVASRFVSQVTLDVLWETQTELVPLFLTLRPCVYVKNYVSLALVTIDLTLTPPTRTRFICLTSR